ncbi:hypothetical protein O7621_03200 [Solwaraspora sp. WMMD937]|uniref:hypothetical protein n=1 Tax=unclassified Solwaraspora TaxID=2627926 RepID=UPI00248BB896|nr:MULTISPECIES: hypothetical protein [unclassified Solwaraspora]WBB97258.1 hypothetical protein O7553_29090 [Solwaraspora sp. WMMA2059]WBC18841.1 hypothetical protein O7543_18280 [Solwaraspora sp. WMMA2080]WFE22373.1 hypothetical protein O7621_03200 [Solwaraspora sp. WMMD937]
MARKRVIVDGSEWEIPESNLDPVLAGIQTAMETGSVVKLELLDGASRPVTVYLNGRTAVTVVVDLGLDPRPSEMS